MLYIDERTKKYPLSIEDIKDTYPNETSFPLGFVPEEYYKIVHNSNLPEHDRDLQVAVEIDPVKIDGNWYRSYKVVSKFKETVDSDGNILTVEQQEQAIKIKKKIDAINFAKQNIANAVKNRLDSFAQEYGYDNIISACSYVNSTVETFASEAHSFIKLRDDTWVIVNNIISDISSGVLPSNIDYDDIKDKLPSLVI